MGFLQLYSDNEWLFHHSLDQQLPPNEYAMHGHDSCEILCVISGRGHFYVEDAVYPVGPGSVFIVRSWEQHRIEIEPNTPYERMVFWFKKEQIEKLDPQHVLLAPFFDRQPGRDNAYADGLWKEWSMIIRHQPSGASPAELCAFAIGQTMCLLCALYTAFVSKNDNRAGRRSGQQTLQPALQYIHDQLFEKISLEDVAKHAYLGTSQLSKLFREAMGMSVYEYIVSKRLAAARFQIESGVKAAQAAEQCGFPTYSAFYKAYRKRFGQAPTADRYI